MLEKIIKIIAKELEKKEEDIKAESRFAEDLGADSLDAVEIIMALEEEFDIEIDDSYFQKIKTVGDIVACIEETKK